MSGMWEEFWEHLDAVRAGLTLLVQFADDRLDGDVKALGACHALRDRLDSLAEWAKYQGAPSRIADQKAWREWLEAAR